MKRSISLAAIAALFAVGTAFTARFQVQQWNVDHPAAGAPGVYFLSQATIKGIYCPGVNNVECAYLINGGGVFVKKP